jgi:serine protease Do
MTSRTVLRQFLVAFLGTVLIASILLHTSVPERFAYQIQKGRLRAMSEALPSQELMDQLNRPNRVVAELVTPAVVRVAVTREIRMADAERLLARSGEDNSEFNFGETHPWLRGETENAPEGEREDSVEVQETGSGFVFDAEQGHVLTNYHVLDGGDRVEVYLRDGRRYEAEVVGADPATDLAVLSIPPERLHEIEFGDSQSLAVGDDVFAIGNPFGLDGTFSRGIVSALGRSTYIRNVRYQGFIQTDAVINPGNSGGPLVNRRGEVIGVNTAIATDTGRFDGVGFAIPSSRVVGLLPKLLTGERIVRGFLGVGTIDIRDDRELAESLGWTKDHGVIVTSVWQSSPAAEAGLEMNDILVEVNGEKITSGTELMDRVALIDPGTQSKVTYWRNGRLTTVEVEIARRPQGI